MNQALARRLWPGRSPIGERLELGCRNKSLLTVTGVVRDSRFVSLGEAAAPHVYRPFEEAYEGGLQTIIVEHAGSLVDETVRKALLSTNAAVRVYEIRSLRDWVDRSYWQVQWIASLIGAFAALALVLAAVGLHGIIAYQVSLRTREIGVRMASGARPDQVSLLVVGNAMWHTAIGILVGIVVSSAVARLAGKLLYGVSPADPLTYGGVSLLWLAAAAAASYFPARRAARIDPIAALRRD